MLEAPPKIWQSPFDRTLTAFGHMHPSDHSMPQATDVGGQASTSGSHLRDDDNSLHARMEEEMRIALILNKNLSPDYITTRPGGGGSKLSYIEAWQVVNIANEVFGYNGWYTEVKELAVDFCDVVESKGEKRYSVSASAVVRVWLRSGGHGHEDVGCGSSVNQKSKSDAYQSAKKEAITDGMKRAMRLFGNVLGNCIYDKNYCGKVMKMAKPPMKPFLASELYNGPDAPIARAPVPAASTSAAMAPPTVPQTRAQPPTGNAGASTSRATLAHAAAQQQPAKSAARVPVVPLPNHAAPQPRAPAVVTPVAFEEGLFDNLDFSSQSMHEEASTHVGGGFEEGDSGFAEEGASGQDNSTLESNENDPGVALSRELDTSAADARAARLQTAQHKKAQLAQKMSAVVDQENVQHNPTSTVSAAQMRSNNAPVPRTGLRPAQPPTRAQSHNPAKNASHAGPSNASGPTTPRQFVRTTSSGAVVERTVHAGQLPSFNVGSAAGRMGGVSLPVAGTGFTSASRIKRNADGSPGSGSGDGLIHGGSSGSRAPLGEVEFDSMGDVKRARYDH